MTIPHFAILYVDDDPRNIHAFRLSFRDQFRILTATSPTEALGILEKEPVAVLLADYRMQDMTGAELCAETKRRFPDVIRMIVTAYTDVGAAVDAVNKGEVARYFMKPWREEQLADAVRAGIEAYQLGTLARDLQVRLLQHEQQATSTFVLGRVLHEVVSPAVAIRDNLGFLADSIGQLAKMAAAGDPDVPRLARDLVPALEDAYGSAQDLVARIERFRQGEAPAASGTDGASLERTVQAAVGIMRARVRERARLVLDLTDKAIARADAMQLSQVLVNLLLNAYEAIEPGQPEGNQITVTTFSKSDRCGFVVEDTGRGVPPELRNRIFEPFVSSKDGGANRGLGLAIVHDIVESLGGRIELDQDARSTRFYVELPRAG